MDSKKPIGKAVRTGLAVIAVIVVYAYGTQVTDVGLSELKSEQRQASLVRVLRALAHPEIFKYDQAQTIVNAPVYVPCPADGSQPQISAPDMSQAYLVVTPACGNPGDVVQVEGFHFGANLEGPLRFVPGSDPTNVVTLGRDNVDTDENGHFLVSFTLPNRLSPDEQFIRATLSQNVGSPHLTQNAYDTWDKIIETVFLALLATTAGTVLAIPLSFIAARNLMKPIRIALASIALSILGWPVGIWAGYKLVAWIDQVTSPATSNLLAAALSAIAVPVILFYAVRWALPEADTQKPSTSLQMVRRVVLVVLGLLVFYELFAIAGLATSLGSLLDDHLGPFSFLGNFTYQLGDILRTILPLLGALAFGAIVSAVFSRAGRQITERLEPAAVKVFNIITAMAAGALVLALLGAAVEWFYLVGNPLYTFWAPAAVGAAFGLLAALRTRAKDTVPIGMIIYYITRTILNGLRAIEPLVMGIVFVITVGIGPFAGMLALGLHTVVSLAKLYSEQVENIAAGPLEAIQATGADRLQTITYAVVPQIVPPYIAYTMYRWDVNVRMSTIIGFVGGGGIGFLLQQNINLLNYRAASTQMIAIAIVVATLDYVSSAIRERFV